ncbi:MAG: potassium channel family protein [Azoarcus sp.]|jgi:Trk K+ transport system NAD-binding subunit|nr:potassium channel family protein [Azoarcus sp.]
MVVRRLRAPLILLIGIISISVLGLTLAPGPLIDGQPSYMSFFRAFYFISYTATTIGFGEIPYEFSDQQRLWVVFCIYMSVVGWAYTLGTVFALLADRNLQHAIALVRFRRAVFHMSDPFCLVCGYGETGRMICQSLDRRGLRMVVIEINETRAGEVDLFDYDADVPALAANASNPDILQQAGLTQSNCAGVIAVTNDDDANLAISIAARLLSPRVPVVARAETRETAVNIAAFGTDHIINPFESFTEILGMALRAPAAWHLLGWLTGLPGTPAEHRREPPRGVWILCGYNRLGRLLAEALATNGSPVTIIDYRLQGDTSVPPTCSWLQGNASERGILETAGIQKAAGLAVCTESDVNNLSIAVTACELNKNLFVLMRQNHVSNHALFEAFAPDFAFIPSEIIAHECLSILSTPLLADFLSNIHKRDDEEWCAWLLGRLTSHLGKMAPEIWSERINLSHAPALYRRLMRGETIVLDQLLHSHANHYEYLACEVLYIARDNGDEIFVPAASTPILPGDEFLLAGRPGARNAFSLNISNDHALTYILTGSDIQCSWIWSKLTSRRTQEKKHRLP